MADFQYRSSEFYGTRGAIYFPMQKITYFPRRLGGFLIGCDYQRVKQFVCHNCDRIGVFCDKHCDGIERFLEGSSSEALEYLG